MSTGLCSRKTPGGDDTSLEISPILGLTVDRWMELMLINGELCESTETLADFQVLLEKREDVTMREKMMLMFYKGFSRGVTAFAQGRYSPSMMDLVKDP